MKMFKNNKFLRFALPVVIALALVATSIGATSASTVPTITIDSVTADKSVTISGVNFPVGQKFVVLMGAYGTFALNGIKVGKLDPSTETFTASFDIPAELQGLKRIAIRMDSVEGFFSYNWFFNADAELPKSTPSPEATPAASTYSGHPYFTISDVEKNVAVDIEIQNLPPMQTFTVKMGKFMTLGLGGIEVGTFDSGVGGTVKKTFSIPADLADLSRIAIRFDSPEGYFAYNWFWNTSTGAPAAGSATPATTEAPAFSGIPTIHVDGVAQDESVTISGKNFPAGETFAVTMGEYGKLGVGGVSAGSYDSTTGGDFTGVTFTIPAELAGKGRIAIRLESADGLFFAYNWFWNNTTR